MFCTDCEVVNLRLLGLVCVLGCSSAGVKEQNLFVVVSFVTFKLLVIKFPFSLNKLSS